MTKRTKAKPPPPPPQPRSIPADMPRTDPSPRHPVDGWEASNSTNAEIGTLRIAHVPGSTLIGLFVRVEAIMFPLAYFRNWHCAHRFASWMEGTKEPEPTLAQEWKTIMEHKMAQVDDAAGITATLQEGVMTIAVTDDPVVPTAGLPTWPPDEDNQEGEESTP